MKYNETIKKKREYSLLNYAQSDFAVFSRSVVNNVTEKNNSELK